MSTTTALANVRTRQEWAEIIVADCQGAIDSTLKIGNDLIAARAELQHGEFTAMVESDLPFNVTQAQRLMRVAKDPKFLKASSRTHLPTSWRVLSALTPLSDADFEAGIESGIIGPDTSLRAADAYQGAAKLPKGETWGAERKPSTLPTSSEARKIARETGRFVAASDGNIYSGATVEEGAEYRDRRTVAFRIIEAIGTLAEAPETFAWLRTTEQHWFVDFRPGAIDDAREWLGNLKEAMEIVDA